MVQYLKDAELFPHVLILGDDKTMSHTFTIISDSAIEVDTLFGAADLCFKAFFVFDLNYTPLCRPAWEFMQSAVYQFCGKESPHVT